nr:reverse transcriptase domain-containing protein [Tanacetum cinerariifolium]
IESKSKVRQSRAKAVVAKVNSSSSTPAISPDVAKLKDMSNFNQSQLHRPEVNQAPAYQAHIPQTQCVSQTDFERYVKANDAVLRNIQSQGPTIPTPSKVVKLGTEVTKDQVQTRSSQSTTHIQPSITQSETPVSEPIVAPVSALMPNLKPPIPYPSRRDNERRSEQANERIEKFYEIFKDMSFKISFTDALILMPKFASTLKALIGNKEKLNEMARTPINEHCLEEYFQEVLGFSDVTTSGSPTPSNDPIVSTVSPTLIPFGDSDFLLFEEAKVFPGLEDDPNSSELDPSYYDMEGDIQMLEAILNSDPAPSLPNHEQSVPSFTNELKACEAKTIKSFVDEPPEVKLKDLPPHLKYRFLEGDNKLSVIISKELGDEEKAALIKVLKSHKRAIA